VASKSLSRFKQALDRRTVEKNIAKEKKKNKMDIFCILTINILRYFNFKDAEQLPSEIIVDRTVETHPCSPVDPRVHEMKVSLQPLAKTLI
jgi:hypothetical protein